MISFVKAGMKRNKNRNPGFSLLSAAADWQLIVDLITQLKFPIAKTTLRPDLVLYSDSTKICIIWELSVPWEEHLALANERKRSKYHELVEQCRLGSWKIEYDPIEVGCRGFTGQSFAKSFAKIGIVGAAKVKAIRNITNEVLAASKWIWLKRSEAWRRRKLMEEAKP